MIYIYKCCLIITINLIISINLNSQPYKSIFGKENTQWNILTYNLSSWICVLSTNIDTVINNKTYKGIVYFGNNCYYADYKKIFIREDSLSGKAWILDLILNKERLIMDLSLNVGDTFNIFPNNSSFDTIAIIDSVYIENDLKKVRLNINYQFVNRENLTFIEGIGTNIGIDYQVNNYFLDYFGNTYLLCSYKDNHLVYKNIFVDTCYIDYVGIKEDKLINKIRIYPNPANKQINIKSPKNIKAIKIFNLLGAIYYSSAKMVKKNDEIFSIDCSQFPKGIYFIKLNYENTYETNKIIIN